MIVFQNKGFEKGYFEKIPLKTNTRSLNISIAAAITLSEALKQNISFKND